MGRIVAGIGMFAVMAAGVVFAADWFNAQTGIKRLIFDTWSYLSGLDNVGTLFSGECEHPEIVWLLIAFVLMIIYAIAGLIAFVGIPAGLIITGLGVLVYFGAEALDALYREGLSYSQKLYVLGIGLAVFGVGLAGVVAAGLLVRLMHHIDTAYMCPIG